MYDSIFVDEDEYSYSHWCWNDDYTVKTYTYKNEYGYEIHREYK